MNDYSRIIEHEHYQSEKRPRMTMLARAAQFAPFAALSGFDEAINETKRQTSERVELEEDSISDIDRTLRYAMFSHKPVDITYFLPDPLKRGGSYITISGMIDKIDMHEDVLLMEDYSVILLYTITDVRLSDGSSF